MPQVFGRSAATTMNGSEGAILSEHASQEERQAVARSVAAEACRSGVAPTNRSRSEIGPAASAAEPRRVIQIRDHPMSNELTELGDDLRRLRARVVAQRLHPRRADRASRRDYPTRLRCRRPGQCRRHGVTDVARARAPGRPAAGAGAYCANPWRLRGRPARVAATAPLVLAISVRTEPSLDKPGVITPAVGRPGMALGVLVHAVADRRHNPRHQSIAILQLYSHPCPRAIRLLPPSKHSLATAIRMRSIGGLLQDHRRPSVAIFVQSGNDSCTSHSRSLSRRFGDWKNSGLGGGGIIANAVFASRRSSAQLRVRATRAHRGRPIS